MTSFSAYGAPISFAEVAQAYLSTYSNELPQLQKITMFTQANTTEYGKRKIVFDMFQLLGIKDLYTYINIDKEHLITLLNDADIVSNAKEPGKHLMSKIDRTLTISGEAILAHLLANPLNDLEVLKTRKQFISDLISDENLYNQIKKLVLQLKSVEQNITSLLSDTVDFTKKFKGLYFGPQLIEPFDTANINPTRKALNQAQALKYKPGLALNKSALALDISNRYQEVVSPISSSLYVTVPYALFMKALGQLDRY